MSFTVATITAQPRTHADDLLGEMHDKLRRAQDLLRHSIPDGDPAKIFDKALTLLLALDDLM
jgi:hypothetical protein